MCGKRLLTGLGLGRLRDGSDEQLLAHRAEVRIGSRGHQLRRGCCGGGGWNCGPLLRLEALAAEHRTSLSRLEGDGGLDAALGALSPSFGARQTGGSRSRSWTQYDAGAFGLAGLATLRVVFELLIEEEESFAGSEDKFAAAVCAG